MTLGCSPGQLSHECFVYGRCLVIAIAPLYAVEFDLSPLRREALNLTPQR
ncbi:MAG: hypothetical protein RMZ95_008400 [Nostoc sp. DedQUE07]